MSDYLEPVYGTNGDDIMVRFRDLRDPRAIIWARAGDDEITSLRRSDRIYAGAGDDLVYGNQGKDELFGGSGSDLLSGGAGADVIWATGNSAGDVDTVVPGSERDIIYGDGVGGRVVVLFDIHDDVFVFAGGKGRGRLGVEVIRTEMEQDSHGKWEVTRAIVKHGDQRIDFQFMDGPKQWDEPDAIDLSSTHHGDLLGGAWWV
jgi:Ca2+-binding RTX toxin-like protein